MPARTKADPALPLAPPRARGRPSRISREQIIGATLDMLSGDGFESFSMARLAARMNASPMALYTYFSGRDALLDAAAETIFNQFGMSEGGAGWEGAIRAWLAGLETLFRRWPVALKLIKWDEHITPAWIPVWLPMVRTLHDAGLRGERLAFASSWFGDMAMSLMVGQLRRPSEAAIERFLEAAAPRDRPLVEEVLGLGTQDRRAAIFEHGTETVIGALRRIIAEGGSDAGA